MIELGTRLVNTLLSQGFQIHTYLIIDQASAVVTWADGTDEVAANAALDQFNWSQAAQTAWEKAQEANSIDFNDKLKGLVALLVDEINDLRQWITLFKASVAGTATLAALKTGVAALPSLPTRTKQQAVTALKNKIVE